jgi:hypothetical protein
MMRIRPGVGSLSLVSVLLFPFAAEPARVFAADPFPAQLPGTAIHQNLPADVEPSGLVWHTRLQQLFVISDNGWLHRMNADGTQVTSWHIWGDLEAVTVADPAGDFVYVAEENNYWVHEFNFVTGSVTRTFDLSPWITAPFNLGIEGLTFVNVAGHAEGGEFYVGMQGDCRILRFSLPVRTSATSTTASYAGTLPPAAGVSVLGDLSYDAASDTLYVLYNGSDVIRAMRPDGAFLGEWLVPLVYQEGLALNPATCDLYLADDAGSVYRYAGFPNGDGDGDGVANCADRCPNTGAGQVVDADGCSCAQRDADQDGVDDCADACPETPSAEAADANGCGCSQRDSDSDGVNDCLDAEPAEHDTGGADEDGPEPGRPTPGSGVVIGGVIPGGSEPEAGTPVRPTAWGACGVGGASLAPLGAMAMLSLRRRPRRRR